MKYSLFLCFFLLSAFCLAQKSDDHTITVTADASRKVEPNIGYLSFEVSTLHDDIKAAKTENDQKVRDVITLLKNEKFDPREIKTEYSHTSEHLDFSVKPDNSKRQYKSSQLMRLTLSDLQRYETVSSELLKRGVARLNGVQLSHTELEKIKEDLTLEALQKAKKKAGVMAKALGLTIGDAVQIFDEQSIPRPLLPDFNALSETVGYGPGRKSEAFPLGTMTIAAKVLVKFELR